jgi:hypothetical protein
MKKDLSASVRQKLANIAKANGTSSGKWSAEGGWKSY